MRKTILATLLVVVAAAISAASGQDAPMNADVVRRAILEVPLWHVDRSGGFTLWHFEMRGDKLWGNPSTAMAGANLLSRSK